MNFNHNMNKFYYDKSEVHKSQEEIRVIQWKYSLHSSAITQCCVNIYRYVDRYINI